MRIPLLEVAPLAFTLVLILTPLIRRLARATGYVDHPGARKAHVESTPLLGGLAIAVALVAGPVLALAITSGPIEPPHIGIVVGALIALTLGMVDDRLPLGPRDKLVGQAAAAVCLVWWGTHVVPIHQNIFLGLLTLLGVIALLNAINFLDNMDGLLSTMIPISAGGFIALAMIHGAPVHLALAWGLIGACSGFLVFNAPPARIFLGDAGSHLLGFALAALSLQALESSFTWPHLTSIVAILAYPIFDVVFVVADRIHGGRPIYLGSTDHTTHRLGRLFGRWGTLAFVAMAAGVNAGVGVWIWGRSDPPSIFGAICGLGLAYAVLGTLLRPISPTTTSVT